MYCTPEDLRESIGGLSLDNKKVTPVFLDDLIKRKSSTIDVYIGQRYVVPINSQDALLFLKDIVIDLCRGPITAKVSVATGNSKTSQTPNAYDISRDALSTLKDIMNGNINIPGLDSVENGLSSGGSFSTKGEILTAIPYSVRPR